MVVIRRRPHANKLSYSISISETSIPAPRAFCGKIWALVLSQVPDARFRIVGRRPSLATINLVAPVDDKITQSVAVIVAVHC